MKKIFLSFTDWFLRNKRIICIAFISLAIIRFAYLNYINWDHGELCTGHGGIQYGYDYTRYTGGADCLVHGLPLNHDHYLYLGYIAFIAFIYKLGLGLEFVLIMQLLFALFAAFAAFDLCRLITGSKTAGFFAAGFILVNPFIIQWHLFIHTESLYSSMLLISGWLITRLFYNKAPGYYVAAILATVFTFLIRPNGWLILPAIITFVLLFSKMGRWYKIAILSVASIVFIIIISSGFLNSMRIFYKISETNNKGRVIWENPETAMDTYFTKGSSEKEITGIKYYAQETYHNIKLGIKRIAAELLPIYRPYNSSRFIIRFLMWMLPVYFMVMIGLLFYFRNKGFVFSALLLLYHLLFISLTYADREFRYLIYVLPVLIMVGSCGLFSSYVKLHRYSVR
jgi:4-amino-4-deoxy-L-arabinose transferase-like glycosyltransferase